VVHWGLALLARAGPSPSAPITNMEIRSRGNTDRLAQWCFLTWTPANIRPRWTSR
jgi:hypothetical protein